MIAREARGACAAVLVDQVIAGRSIFARTGLTFVDICTKNNSLYIIASQSKSVCIGNIPLDSQ